MNAFLICNDGYQSGRHLLFVVDREVNTGSENSARFNEANARKRQSSAELEMKIQETRIKRL